MPRRQTADPLAAAIGQRIRDLRAERGMTLEKLAFESGQISKGHLSDMERGLVVPTIGSLQIIADCLEVLLVDLVVNPGNNLREQLVEVSRKAPESTLRRWLSEAPLAAQEALPGTPAAEPRRLFLHTRRVRNGVPLVDLSAVAGALAAGRQVSRLGWIKLDDRARQLPGAFVARVVGNSMEPRILDGSYALFRRPGPGNRSGRILLVQHRVSADPEDGGSYLLKLVERLRVGGEEQLWLRSLHPAVPPRLIDPNQEEIRAVAEFVRVVGNTVVPWSAPGDKPP